MTLHGECFHLPVLPGDVEEAKKRRKERDARMGNRFPMLANDKRYVGDLGEILVVREFKQRYGDDCVDLKDDLSHGADLLLFGVGVDVKAKPCNYEPSPGFYVTNNEGDYKDSVLWFLYTMTNEVDLWVVGAAPPELIRTDAHFRKKGTTAPNGFVAHNDLWETTVAELEAPEAWLARMVAASAAR